MRDFVEWCFSLDAPIIVNITAGIMAVTAFIIYFLVIVMFFESGLWVVGVFMSFCVPLWFLINQYGNRNK